MLEFNPGPELWLAFLTLSVLEIVLGIDNLIFIAIFVAKLPQERRRIARHAGLGLAMVTRIALLYSIVWLTRLTAPWFLIGERSVSGRDVVLLGGGLFLLGKSVVELHSSVEGDSGRAGSDAVAGRAADPSAEATPGRRAASGLAVAIV